MSIVQFSLTTSVAFHGNSQLNGDNLKNGSPFKEVSSMTVNCSRELHQIAHLLPQLSPIMELQAIQTGSPHTYAGCDQTQTGLVSAIACCPDQRPEKAQGPFPNNLNEDSSCLRFNQIFIHTIPRNKTHWNQWVDFWVDMHKLMWQHTYCIVMWLFILLI